MAAFIALLTDFGTKDSYTGIVKGVLFSLNPDLKVIDLTHEIRPQDINQGAFILGTSYKFLPTGTIIIAVVDPGVGTERRGLILEAGEYTFVAPDNGLLTFPMVYEKGWRCFEIKNSDYFLHPISTTFHARDVFAPVAAHIAAGEPIENFGPLVHDPILIKMVEPVLLEKEIKGQIIYIDRFGNLITNIPGDWLRHKRVSSVKIKDHVLPFVKTYNDVPPGKGAALVGSSGLLEIAVNKGNASHFFNVNIGEGVLVQVT